jgi:hypothetical protein
MISKAGGPLREPLRPGQCLVLVRSTSEVTAGSTDFVVENLHFKLVGEPETIDGPISATGSNAYVLNCTFEEAKRQSSQISCTDANLFVKGAMPSAAGVL